MTSPIVLKQSVDRLASDMRDRFDQVDQRFERLEAQIRAESAETREYVDLAAHETRRHFDVVAESMEERFKSLADGISANRETARQDLTHAGQAGVVPTTPPLPDLLIINVRITWKERGTNVSTALTTLRARGF